MTTERFVETNGLRYHVVEWPAEGPFVLLAHGFLDLAWSWRGVAERLQAQGYHCVAWDWRGHGESDHVGQGGYYHFPDYVLDLEYLIPQITGDRSVHLVGHSMGGTISTMYAGLRSDRLASLTLVEGLGPPNWGFEKTPEKFRAWLDSVEKIRTRPKRSLTLESALRRMRIQNPELPEELGEFLAEKATVEIDGRRRWRFDPLHRTTAPMPFRTEVFNTFLHRIEVPTLVIAAERGFRLPDERERYQQIPDHRFVEIADVGHMIHWMRPDALADAIVSLVR
ncbi:MAG: alpha/beta hydrolase [Myxococcota bacterium]